MYREKKPSFFQNLQKNFIVTFFNVIDICFYTFKMIIRKCIGNKAIVCLISGFGEIVQVGIYLDQTRLVLIRFFDTREIDFIFLYLAIVSYIGFVT